MLVLLIYFTIPELEPVLFQRISMGKNIAQVKKAFLISFILLFLVILSTAWLPFLVFNLNPNLDENHLLSYVVDNYTYPGLKGLIIIGVVAMAMSSADSFINIASVLFANDFCKPLNIGKNNELILSRLFACCLGAGAMTLALIETDLLTIVLTANSFYMPIVTVPFMVAVFGFRTTKKSVLIAMSAGFITVIIWEILKIEMDCIIFAMLINFIFLIGSHYFLKQFGGWTSFKNNSYVNMQKKERKRKIIKLISIIKNFSLIEFCKKTSPKNELMYIGLDIYCIFYTFTTMYSTQVELLKDNGKTVLTIYQIMIITGVILQCILFGPHE